MGIICNIGCKIKYEREYIKINERLSLLKIVILTFLGKFFRET